MRIAHLVLANQYAEGFLYQENQLAYQNMLDGHEVLVIASTNVIGTKGSMSFLEFTEPCRFVDENGVDVVRVPYRYPLPSALNAKLRIYSGVQDELEKFAPDLMMFHGVGGAGVWEAVAYKKKHPEVVLVVDNHASFDNSALHWFTKYLYHSFFGRLTWKGAWKHVDKVYNVAKGCDDFLETLYGVAKEQTELLPLGGKALSDAEYISRRRKTRERLGVSEDHTLLLHSGKMVAYKRVWELVEAFDKTRSDKTVFLLAGNMDDETTKRMSSFMSCNDQVRHVGWVDSNELTNLLCAADVYVQGWSQSATVQHAACLRCAVVVVSCESYRVLLGESPYYIENISDLERVIEDVVRDRRELNRRAELSFSYARKNFTYESLAERLYRLVEDR